MGIKEVKNAFPKKTFLKRVFLPQEHSFFLSEACEK